MCALGKERTDFVGYDDPKGAVAEAFCALRTSLSLSPAPSKAKLLAVTSSVPSEGKSFVTLNLALTYARGGKRVLLVDCGMWRRRLTYLLKADKCEMPGLSNLLAGTVTETVAALTVKSFSDMVLTFLPAGPTPPNPVELLGSKSAPAFFAGLESQYDLVIVDTAPVLLVSAPLNLTAVAGLKFLVVGQCLKTEKKQVEETVTQAARTNVALSERLLSEKQFEAAEAHLAVNPRNAAALSALLERPVSSRQSERSVYALYLGQALALLPEGERQSLAEGFGAVERAALALALVSPSNASTVSIAATAADNRAFWLRAPQTAVAWHRYTVAQAPTSVTVLARVVRGLALAVAGADDAEKAGLVRDFTVFAKRLAGEVPSDLTWLLPLTETVGMTADEVASLVPERIQGQELFARWLLKNGDYESALSALDRAEVLNDARLEDGKPWTMGRAVYLAREKREKREVALVVDQLRLSAYEGLGDETAAADVAERIRAREAVLYETVIARADALMADELLKSLKSALRALVRRAKMALTMNRLEGAGQRMEEFKDIAALADDETRVQAAKVLERLDSLRDTGLTTSGQR